MVYIYRFVEQHLYNEYIGYYRSYGVEISDENYNIIRIIDDVSVDKEAISSLVSLCNQLKLDVIHIDDVIDDFLKF